MKLKEFIIEFANKTKDKIAYLAKTELSNENKKLALDHTIVDFLDDTLDKLAINFVFKAVLKKLILPNISLITQIIFDLLKAKIDGVTK